MLQCVQLTVNAIEAISLFGCPWQPTVSLGPMLFGPLPCPAPGLRADIAFAVAANAPAFTQVSMPSPGEIGPGGQAALISSFPSMSSQADVAIDEVFEDDFPVEDSESESISEGLMQQRIEAAWKSAVQIERQLTGLRQKLSSMQTALGKLDRELTPDERLASDREDRDEWADLRRWLRDLQGKCHREIKAFDIGMTSSAGVRNTLEQRFLETTEGRVRVTDLPTLRKEFEKYRKDLMCLQRAMTAALQSSVQNGTQRAQRVIGKIGVKIREMRARNREPIAGTNMDRTCRRKKL